MKPIEYQWTDVWLLVSIILSGGEKGANVDDIDKMGDAINHAGFTANELESGFARLTAGGLITERQKIFSPTEKAMELYRKASEAGDRNRAMLEQFAKLLEAAPYKFPNPKNNLAYWGTT